MTLPLDIDAKHCSVVLTGTPVPVRTKGGRNVSTSGRRTMLALAEMYDNFRQQWDELSELSVGLPGARESVQKTLFELDAAICQLEFALDGVMHVEGLDFGDGAFWGWKRRMLAGLVGKRLSDFLALSTDDEEYGDGT